MLSSAINPEMAIEVVQDPQMDSQLSLDEFLECFTAPQSAKIVEGSNPDFDLHQSFGISCGSSLVFHRKFSPTVSLKFQDPDDTTASARTLNEISLPVDFQGRFCLLPYDPVSGDTSGDHIYRSVGDLVQAFPVYVQANATHGDKAHNPKSSFDCGDRLKLIRLIFKDGVKFMECKLLSGPCILHLPMTCVGDFTVMPDQNAYLLGDIMSMLPRKRRVNLVNSAMRKPINIPGLPSNYTGDLFVEEPEAFVEATPVDDPSLIIGIPCDLRMMLSPDEPGYDRGENLSSFATQNRNLLPVVARVSDWAEETTILENHYVKPGVEIVIHGWTRQSKVLALFGDVHYAIPLTYTGLFRIKPKQYHGVSELERAYPGNKLQVIRIDADEANFPLNLKDVIKIKREDTLKRKTFAEVEIRCEKYDASGRLREIKLPLTSTAIFEEYLEDAKNSYTIKELVSFVSDQELMVELTGKSSDQKSPDRDIPIGRGILLCDFVIEPAVYVSVESPESPALHIPLRTLINVIFLYQLERSASPLLTKNKPRLSTLDRCVEILAKDVFDSLRPQRALDTSHSYSRSTSQTPTTGWIADGGKSGWPSSLAHTRDFDVLSGKPHKPPSVAGSDVAPNKTKGLSKVKTKFRRHKSQENLLNNGSVGKKTDLAPLSMPRQTMEYTRSQTNGNVILAERTSAVHRSQIHVSAVTQGGSRESESSSSVDNSVAYSNSGSSSSSPQPRGLAGIPVHTVNVLTPRSNQRNPTTPKTTQHQTSPIKTRPSHAQSGLNGHQFAIPPAHTLTDTAAHTPTPAATPDSSVVHTPQPMEVPPGYALVSMSTPQSGQGPASYVLVPVMSPDSMSAPQQMVHNHSLSSDDEDDDEEYDSGVYDIRLKKTKFKVTIPADGNLYHLTAKKFGEFLQLLRIDDQFIQNCVKQKIDGKRFSRLESSDLQQLGIMHPIVVHFRKLTTKKKHKFML